MPASAGNHLTMPETPDKPAGTESHPPDENPERQGPERGRPKGTPAEEPPPDREPRPEASPGEPGITSPKQGRV
jgi:hypothetical protein